MESALASVLRPLAFFSGDFCRFFSCSVIMLGLETLESRLSTRFSLGGTVLSFLNTLFSKSITNGFSI